MNSRTRIAPITVSLAAALLLAGCVSYKGVHLTYPREAQVVAERQPALMWKAVKDPGVTYDVGVWEVPEGGSSEGKKEFCIVENIKDTTLRVPRPLEPGKTYQWSVRTRKGSEAAGWTMRQTIVVLIVYNESTTKFPTFKTSSD